MSSASRTALFAKIHKVLKKCYKPWAPPETRSVLEHLLFACCLEDARYEPAEEAFAALQHTFFDWNEVRVTSITELSEVLSALPDPRAAANRVKRVLHGIFEQTYSFDLEEKRKKNLGPAVKWFEDLDGATRFSVAYVAQAALDGHSIPIDCGAMSVLRLLDLVSDKDAADGVVPGLERAIAKNKGVEFGSLLHQLGADFTANPYGPAVRDVLQQIDPEVTPRLPQRRMQRPAEKPASEPLVRDRAGRKKKPEAAEGEDSAHQADAKGAAVPPKSSGECKRAAANKKPSPEHAGAAAERGEKKADSPAEGAKEKPTAEGLAKRKPR